MSRKLDTYKTTTDLDKALKTLSNDKNVTIMKPLPFPHLSDGDTEDVEIGSPSWGTITSQKDSKSKKYVNCVLLTTNGEEIPVSRQMCDNVKQGSKLSIVIQAEPISYFPSGADITDEEQKKTIIINKALFNGMLDE